MYAMVLVAIFLVYIAGSLYYVYKFRGNERYEDFTEYVRKGWPIFTPFNCLLYMFTQQHSKAPILDAKDFKELEELQKNWMVIREEAMRIFDQGYFDKIKDPNSSSFYDIGFRTFYKYGWSKFYLNWYGYTHDSAKKLCPKTVEILSKVPAVKGAMFSMLPPGGKLTRHLDPVAVSLRYHLGLKTPNSSACFINVDGVNYSWKDGEPFIFDETYLHYANNNSDQSRIILMCDIKRPLNTIGSLVNFFYAGLMRLTIVPNLETDKRGLVNSIFMGMKPILAKTKALKQTNKPLYLLIKHTTNATILILLLAIVYGVIQLGTSLLSSVL